MATKKKTEPTPDDMLMDEVEAGGVDDSDDLLLEDDEEIVIDAPEEDLFKGEFVARCTGIEMGESSTGNKQLEFSFRLLDRDNQSMKMWNSMVPQARWKLIESGAAFGQLPEGNPPQLKLKRSACVGMLVMAHVAINEYKGRKQSRIEKITALTPEQMAEYSDTPDE